MGAMITYYEIQPTEPDGDIVSYRFATADATLDFCETLAGEYGYELHDIDGTRVLGYCDDDVFRRRRNHGRSQCPGHVIGWCTIREDGM